MSQESMSIGLVVASNLKPNILETPENKKDEKYHSDYGRWCVHNANSQKHREHMDRISVAESFYKPGGQWMEREDLETFFKDTTGQVRNRIKTEFNVVNALVRQYMGNANRMSFESRCRSISPLAKRRRDEKLAEMMYFTEVGKQAPQILPAMQENLPIGKNPNETEGLFENLYQDAFLKAMNNLITHVKTVNKFDEKKKEYAQDLATTGMCISKPYIHAGEWRFKRTVPKRFFWDRNALEWDLSDAQFMGEFNYMIPSEIYERYPDLSADNRLLIERWVSAMSISGSSSFAYSPSGRMTVYEVYWRDAMSTQYGYVMDEFDQHYFARINYIEEGEKISKYTDKDLLPYSKLTKYEQEIVDKQGGKGVNKTKITVDLWRYCTFIPSFVLPGGISTNNTNGDVVLEYGKLAFQEPNLFSPSNVESVYKVGFASYINGEVYSPVDIVINPQRVINRMSSVFENQVNNSRGSGTVLDSSAFDGDAEEATSAMNESKAILINGARVGGVQNAVARYDNTIGSGTEKLMQFIEIFKKQIQDLTGVNEAVQGTADNPDQLVGTMQLLIQRGSLQQEIFYDALQCMYQQCIQNIATCGKRLYIKEKRKLTIAVGDDATEVLMLSEDMNLEDVGVTIRRVNDLEKEKEMVRLMAIQYMQMGLLDATSVVNLIGRGTELDLNEALRKYDKFKKQTQTMQEEANKQQLLAASQQAKEQQNVNEQKMIEKDSVDKQHELDKIALKGMVTNTSGEMAVKNE